MGCVSVKIGDGAKRGICPRCLNEFDTNRSGLSLRDRETWICESCIEEEAEVDSGQVNSEVSETVYERELRMHWLCPEGLLHFTDAGRLFMQECWIRKVISDVIVPRIKKLDE